VAQRTWPGFLPPAVALVATLAAALVLRFLVPAADGDEILLAGLALFRGTLPVVLAVVWGAALIMARPHRLAVIAGAGAAGAVFAVLPADLAVALAGATAAGLAAGLALGARWRLDATLAVVAGLLLSTVIVDVIRVPIDSQLDASRAWATAVLEKAIPAGADEAQVAAEKQRIAEIVARSEALAIRLHPLAVLLALLGEALTVLVMTWVVVRLCGWELPSWRPPPFSEWRLPFYLVWCLIAGLGLVLLRHPASETVGLNLAVLSAGLRAVQGVAVQFWVSGRLLSPLGRIVFWTVTGLFATGLIILSGVLLGLADQWLDLRGLERGSDR